MSSVHLTATHIRGLNKLGDHMLPGYGDLQSFSRSGASRNADRVLGYMGEKDLADLKMLLTLMAFLPRLLLAALLGFFELAQNLPGAPGDAIRFIRIGIRGLVMTLYYCDPKITAQIGYRVSVYTEDLPR